jgi:hypothetical protein
VGFARIIKIKDADGSLDETHYAGGLVNDCPDDGGTYFSLGMRRGCLGGVIRTLGTVRDAYTIAVGQTVEFWFDADTLVYAGKVVSRRKLVHDNVHEYELAGWWAVMLQTVQLARAFGVAEDGTLTAPTGVTRVVMGSTVTVDDDGATTGERRVAGKDSPEAIVTWLLDNVLEAAGVVHDALEIGTSGVTVEEFTIAEDMSIYQIMEDLENLAGATANTEKRWVCGIGADKKLYFKAISEAAENLQGTWTIGDNVTEGEEEDRGAAVTNRITLVGGMIEERGLSFRVGFEYTPSVALVGRTAAVRLGVPSLKRVGDATKWALGYFRKAAPVAEETQENLQFQGVRKVHAADTAPPVPWKGMGKFDDAVSGQIKTDYVTQINVNWGASFDYAVTLGTESWESAAGSYYNRTSDSSLSSMTGGNTFGGGYSSISESWLAGVPGATGTDEGGNTLDPYDGAPHLAGSGVPYDGAAGTLPENAGGGSGAGLPLGVAVVTVSDIILGWLQKLKATAMVSNGGNAEALLEENVGTAYPVYLYWKHVDELGALIGTGNYALKWKTTNGALELWASDVQTGDNNGYQPVLPGKIYYALRVKIGPESTDYVWTPADVSGGSTSAAWLSCPYATVGNDPGGGGTGYFETLLALGSGLMSEV